MGLWSDAPTRMKAFTPTKTLEEANVQIAELQNLLAIAIKNISYILNGGIDSRNTREIGGWKVDLTELVSKDGDVGMSTEDTPADDVRLWAGSADKDTAPWRVYESGRMNATGAVIESSEGYPKIVFDPNGDLFGAYATADKYINIIANNAGDPLLYFENPTNTARIALVGGNFSIGAFSNLNVSASGNMTISATGSSSSIMITPGSGGTVLFPSWDKISSALGSKTLQETLDLKADVIDAGYNLVFNNTSRLLKMFNKDGDLMSEVLIPVS